MAAIRPVPYQQLIRVFEQGGFRLDRRPEIISST